MRFNYMKYTLNIKAEIDKKQNDEKKYTLQTHTQTQRKLDGYIAIYINFRAKTINIFSTMLLLS